MASAYAFLVALIYVTILLLFVRFLILGIRYYERELGETSWFSFLGKRGKK
jgi:hypothetical protein